MALKNKSMYAILGILSISPSTGYEIKKYCDTVLSGFWNENFGHIYPTLKRLLEEGMIEIVSEENKRKIRYGITEKGKQEFNIWLCEETAQQPPRSEFMLKLIFASNQPKSQVIQMLEDYKKNHKQKIEEYRKMQEGLEQGIREISEERVLFVRAVLRRGILSDEAVVQWCDETIEQIQNILDVESKDSIAYNT